MITEKQVESALHYLGETDEEFGRLRGAVKSLEYRLKVVRASSFLDSTGNVAERESKALTSGEFEDILNEYKNTVTDMEIISAKRKRAELTVEIWRSEEASRRRGNI